jgi:hypothetical protein
MKTKPSLLQRLQEIGTYAAIIATVVTPIAAVLGFSLNEKLLYSLVALTLLPIVYLIHQYQKAVRKIEDDGVVQRPQWLWRLLTHRVTPKPGQLVQGIVMVVVPPKVRDDAEILNNIHNQNKHVNLLFHYLPLPDPGDTKIDENMAESEPSKKKQPLGTFNKQLENCAGIILLDDCDWDKYKESYPKTWKIINDWSNHYTYRPIMSVRVGKGGTLNKYSWCNLSEFVDNNQALLSNLLAQSTYRSKDWYTQATAQRHLFLFLALILTIALIISLSTNYLFKNRIGQLESEIPKITNVMTIKSEEQWHLTEHLSSFRNSSAIVTKPEELYKLLKGIATQLKGKVIESSGVSKDVDVIFFASKEASNNPGNFPIYEVATTREPPRDFGFSYNLNEKDTTSIVGCALARHSFVYWAGLEQSPNVTKDILVWNLNGERKGNFDGNDKKWRDGDTTCKLGDPPKSSEGNSLTLDDPRHYLLCAPVGTADGLPLRPAGAICISSEVDLKLNGEWARLLLLHYGNLLSFINWENACDAPKSQNQCRTNSQSGTKVNGSKEK